MEPKKLLLGIGLGTYLFGNAMAGYFTNGFVKIGHSKACIRKTQSEIIGGLGYYLLAPGREPVLWLKGKDTPDFHEAPGYKKDLVKI